LQKISKSKVLKQKIQAYNLFTKFRLSFLVIVSAVLGYFFENGKPDETLLLLIFGGLLVTAASNGSNQIWERDLDKLMKRTAGRPLPQGTMSLTEAYCVVVFCLVLGSYMLYKINLQCALLGFASFASYVFVYTPMKRISPWAVFVGAFPGAMPPLLGAIAATNDFGFIPGILFFIQFMWQFPHFWAIAWVAFDDYKAGGFSLLPSKEGKSKSTAFQIVLYTLILIPISILPWVFSWTGITSLIVVSLAGLGFFLYAYKLFLTLDDKAARKLMFASFVYLPIVQLAHVLDRLTEIVK
jgi:heme o synthase